VWDQKELPVALLQLLSEEEIPEDHLEKYFDVLYRIVCVAERTSPAGEPQGPVRSTYVVDWEQLVHLLEDYTYFGEDIVEVSAITGDEAKMFRNALGGPARIARA
jgi:hypothetical protein